MSARRRGRAHGNGAAAPSAPSAPIAAPAAAEAAVAAPVANFDKPVVFTEESVGAEPAAATPRNGDFRGGRGAASSRPTRPRPQSPAPSDGSNGLDGPATADQSTPPKSGATLAQMRRFIKSRPYVPVHELRRRFLIEGMEDEVNPLSTGTDTLYVGLPQQEAGFLGDLIKNGEVGCELLLDPPSPGVIGVFPMRPIARQ
jgi:hypothetical protein